MFLDVIWPKNVAKKDSSKTKKLSPDLGGYNSGVRFRELGGVVGREECGEPLEGRSALQRIGGGAANALDFLAGSPSGAV